MDFDDYRDKIIAIIINIQIIRSAEMEYFWVFSWFAVLSKILFLDWETTVQVTDRQISFPMRPSVCLTFLPAIAVTCCIDLFIWIGLVLFVINFLFVLDFIFKYLNFNLCIALSKKMFSERTVNNTANIAY